MDGFIIINKDKGMTSYDVCSSLKKIFHTKKVGHTGTLDPNTTGVLVVAINNATKLMPLLLEHKKIYETTMMIGKSSDSYDIMGKILIDKSNLIVSEEMIDEALEQLKKEEFQIPPIYSSIKVNGKKLYEYARANEDIEIQKRPIEIYELKRTSNIKNIDGYLYVDLYMEVSKGFYVRSLIHDIGNIINCPTLMFNLNRLQSGDFDIKRSVKLSDVSENKIISIEDVFKDLERININDYMLRLVLNGVILDERQIKTDKPFLVYHNNKLIAVYEPFKEKSYKAVLIIK